MHKGGGFTLLEVLLALLVLSISIAALVRTGQISSENVVKLEQSSAAYHVADQTLMVLYQSSGLTTGRHQGEQHFNGIRWYWVAEVKVTDNPRIAKINLRVGIEPKVVYANAHLIGFKSI